MVNADSATQPSRVFGVNMITRRKFLRLVLLGGLFSLFTKKAKAEKKPENKLKEAMFWRSVDSE